jgi:hypothetical protein
MLGALSAKALSAGFAFTSNTHTEKTIAMLDEGLTKPHGRMSSEKG